MRTRKEIAEIAMEMSRSTDTNYQNLLDGIKIEILLDIRDLLVALTKPE